MFEKLQLWVYEKTPAYWEIVGFIVFVTFIFLLIGVN